MKFMTDPLGFFLLSAVAAIAIVMGVIGIRRGKAVTMFQHTRAGNPSMFWYSIVFQLGLGLVCSDLAMIKIFT
jgi:hypothetical protein